MKIDAGTPRAKNAAPTQPTIGWRSVTQMLKATKAMLPRNNGFDATGGKDDLGVLGGLTCDSADLYSRQDDAARSDSRDGDGEPVARKLLIGLVLSRCRLGGIGAVIESVRLEARSRRAELGMTAITQPELHGASVKP